MLNITASRELHELKNKSYQNRSYKSCKYILYENEIIVQGKNELVRKLAHIYLRKNRKL